MVKFVSPREQMELLSALREQKVPEPWMENYIAGTGYKHPVVVTSGPDNSIIHLLCLDPDESFTATNAQPARGFILYSRSTDGGQTWDISNVLLDGWGRMIILDLQLVLIHGQNQKVIILHLLPVIISRI